MNDTTIILIVDDNPTNLSVLFEYLEESGYEIAVAQSGEDALRQIGHVNPDLILLDILLPGINGFETCRRLKEVPDTKKIPVIFMTALANEIDKVKGFLAGGADYITKPLHHEEVLVRINSHLQIRNLEQTIERQQQQIAEQQERLIQQEQVIQTLQSSKDILYRCVSEKVHHSLDSLIGYTRLIDDNIDEYGKDDVRNNIRRLRHSAEELSTLHENLMLWSKFQRNALDIRPQTIAIDEIAVYNILLHASSAQAKQITINSAIRENTPVQADERMLHVVFRNLLANALETTETTGHITLSAEETGKMLQVTVSDNGHGMKQADLQQLLQKEESWRNSVSDVDEDGTGFSLKLCKALIEKNGGTLWGESRPGGGTTIRFTLPTA